MTYFLLILLLFYVFFKIGLFTIGGGYAMIPLIISEAISRNWLTLDELTTFIGISEMTPGPFAINIATFVGMSQAGFLGAVVSTIAVVLPSFIIILLIAKFFHKLMDQPVVNAILRGIQPVVVALILASAVYLIYQNVVIVDETITFDLRNLVLLIDLGLIYFGYRHFFKKSVHPILLVVLGAVLGILVFYL